MRPPDRIGVFVLLAGAVFVGIEAWRLAIWSAPGIPGPGFLPFLLAIGLVAGAVGVYLEGALSRSGGTAAWFADRGAIGRLLALLVAIVALISAVGPLGMLTAVGLFLLAFLSFTLRGRWTAILFIALGTPLCLHLVFERWLKFTLPRGFLGF